MAKIVNKTGNYLEYYSLVNGTIQGSGNLAPGKSTNCGGRKGLAIKYWKRGKPSTSKIIDTEDHNGIYDLY